MASYGQYRNHWTFELTPFKMNSIQFFESMSKKLKVNGSLQLTKQSHVCIIVRLTASLIIITLFFKVFYWSSQRFFFQHHPDYAIPEARKSELIQYKPNFIEPRIQRFPHAYAFVENTDFAIDFITVSIGYKKV